MPFPTRPAGRTGSRAGAVTRENLTKIDAVRAADGGRRTASAGAVLRAVLDNGPIARSTIARIAGLSPASVTGHCAELVRLGLLCELPQVRSNGAGRPHIPVDVDLSRHVVAAVHFGVPATTTALLDLRGGVLVRSRMPHDSSDPERIVQRAAQSLAALCTQYGAGAGPRPLGLGVATAGWVEPESGTVMEHPRLGWSRVPVRDWLSERTGLPVHVDGHCRALLHGEVLFGGARQAASVLHVFVGNVVEAAFATQGAAHYGSRAQAGLIAHLPVDGGREPCSCGRVGCLEATVSEESLARQAHQRGLIAAPDFRLLLAAGRAGDRDATRLLVERSRLVGRTVAMLIDVFGPELAVVTDPALCLVPAALTALRDAARENVRAICDIDRMLIPTGFPDTARETAGGAVVLDALYRDPLGFADRINSESCNVDTPGPRR